MATNEKNAKATPETAEPSVIIDESALPGSQQFDADGKPVEKPAAAPPTAPEADIETETDEAPAPLINKRRTILAALGVAGLVVLAIVGLFALVAHELGRTANQTVPIGVTENVTIPAYDTVDATGCGRADLEVVGNKLIFKNDCAFLKANGQ